MSIVDAFKALICAGYTDHVTKMSLHDGDPGITGVNDSGVAHADVVWGGETDGIDTAEITFDDLVGDFTYVGLWEGSTFRQGIPCTFSFSTPASVTFLLTHDATGL